MYRCGRSRKAFVAGWSKSRYFYLKYKLPLDIWVSPGRDLEFIHILSKENSPSNHHSKEGWRQMWVILMKMIGGMMKQLLISMTWTILLTSLIEERSMIGGAMLLLIRLWIIRLSTREERSLIILIDRKSLRNMFSICRWKVG